LVDILVKEGDTLTLIEVKSKKYEADDSFFQKRKPHYLNADWRPYLLDVAFQTWVARQAFPELTVNPELMLLDGGA
jgi:Holliday junction resolvase-like predicted endonuclease